MSDDGPRELPPVLLAVCDLRGFWDFAWICDSSAALLGPRISVAEELLYVAFKGGPWVNGKEALREGSILRITDGERRAVYRLTERNACSMTYSAEWPD